MNNNINTPAKKSGQQKKKLKFNFIDFLLILLILAIIATVIYVFAPFSWIEQRNGTIDLQYTIEIQAVDEVFIENIQENDIVIDSVSKNVIGSVVAVDYNTQYSVLQYDESSREGILSVIPDKYNLIITISTDKAVFNDGEGYSINGCRIAVGEKINAKFPNYIAEGYCIGID